MQAIVYEDPDNRDEVLKRRVEAAIRTIYPRIITAAHRLLRGTRDLEAGDLGQDGLLAAVRSLDRPMEQPVAELGVEALAAVLYAIAAKAMRDRLIDHIRRQVRRRNRAHLLGGCPDIDRSFEAGREARDILDDMIARASEPSRRVLQAAVDAGEVDVALIMERTGFSRPYVYRLLQKLAEAGQAE